MDSQTYGTLLAPTAAPAALAPWNGMPVHASPTTQESPAAIQEHFSRILEGGGVFGQQALSSTGSAEQRRPLDFSTGSMSRHSVPPGHSADSIPRRATPVGSAVSRAPDSNAEAWASARFRPSPIPSMAMPLQPGRSQDFLGQGTPSFQNSAAGVPGLHGACWANNDFVGNPDKSTSSDDKILSLAYFPSMFTLSCILIFFSPIWLMVHLGQDRTVMYWLGSWCRTTIFLPLLFLLGHHLHMKRQGPSKAVVIACLLVPTVFLLVLGDSTMTHAADKADQLFSTDCDTFDGKRQLERSWLKARDLYVKCLEDTVRLAPASKNLTYSAAARLYRIQDCEEYATEQRLHQVDWEYLWYLEDEYACAGWCTRSHPLWTFKAVQDSCSVAAAQIFDGKVAKRSGQVVLYSLAMLVLTSVLLLAAGPFLRARGYDW